MFTTKKSETGFTILEMLIALAISAIVMGGVYAAFTSLINTKESTEKSNYKNALLLSARQIFKPDALQMHKDSLNIHKTADNDELSFTTNNSIKMEKAFPVDVHYYVENGYLIREESSAENSYDWKLYLIKNVTDFRVQSHNGFRFTDDYDKMDTILKISFKVSGYPVTFIAGCGHVSLTPDYLGAAWH